jgi:16S rRNA (guanine966-N2)-methyltransferase
VRVVAGTAGGRRLVAPKGSSIRPTSDRVREAMFSSLVSMGAIDGASVLDLYCGSGALGIEALSRGAARAVFVDETAAAVAATRANLSATGLAARADVVRADAVHFCRDHRGDRFDLAFADPPYQLDEWDALLETLPAGLAVLESDREPRLPGGWRLLRTKRYGGTVVTLTELTEPED